MKFLKIIILFFAWFIDHFNLPGMFTPVSFVNKILVVDEGKFARGVTDIYIFGLRIARIHKTKPWLVSQR